MLLSRLNTRVLSFYVCGAVDFFATLYLLPFLLLLLIYILITCNPSCVTTALHDIPALLQSHYSSSESLSMWILYYVPTVVKPKSGFMTSIIIADIDCTPYTSSTLRKGGLCFRHDLF